MSLSHMMYLLKWDYRMNQGYSFDHFRAKFLLTEIRLEQYVYAKSQKYDNVFINSFWFLMRFLGSLFQWFFFNSNIPGSVKIGRGMRLPHPQNLTIAYQAVIGEFCVMYHGVSIVWNGFRSAIPESPKVGDQVLIGTRAILVGDVTIGDNVLIGAGTVVPKSVPSNSRIVGTAAVVSQRYPDENAAVPGSPEHIRSPYNLWRRKQRPVRRKN